MATPEQINPEVEKLFLAKNKRRHRLAAMSYPEKVRALVQLQRMVYPRAHHDQVIIGQLVFF